MTRDPLPEMLKITLAMLVMLKRELCERDPASPLIRALDTFATDINAAVQKQERA